jgi:ABC-type nitrate/sulfonate/bicarbonate transport system permease component
MTARVRRVLLPATVAIGAWILWEALARSGLLYRGIVPSSFLVFGALLDLLRTPDFYHSLGISMWEIGVGMFAGSAAGWLVGVTLGISPFLSRAYEPWLYYLGATPKIILLPVLIMLFGAGVGSKMAMGALSCFFPVTLSIAAGMRDVDRTLVNVGHSFCLTRLQMLRFIYLPSSVRPTLTGLRLGFGVTVVGVLLSETKIARAGIGFVAIQAYDRFQIPEMYALLIVIFAVAALVNLLIGRIVD